MALSFIQYPLIMSRESTNSNNIESKTLRIFEFNVRYILFYSLFAIYLHL